MRRILYILIRELKPELRVASWTILLGGSIPITIACPACRRLNVRETEWWVNLSYRVLGRSHRYHRHRNSRYSSDCHKQSVCQSSLCWFWWGVDLPQNSCWRLTSQSRDESSPPIYRIFNLLRYTSALLDKFLASVLNLTRERTL